jgi:putative FmdB family regulatory protein
VPTYQYTCTDCGEPVEALQKFTDEPLTVCAACGGRLRKVFSPVGIVFKGSGFYRTDSRKGVSATAPVAAKDTPSGESSSAASSDSAASDSNGSAAKKSETVGAAAKSSSSEKVA